MQNKILFIALGFLISFSAMAQRDTTQSITITSSYKPVLRYASKINFSGTALQSDTEKNVAPYHIPAQNLFYAYRPISLKPLALQMDTNLYLGNRNYVKAGFGSYSTPFADVGFSLGDGKQYLLNLTGNYIGSKGKDIEHQDYAQMNLEAAGSYFKAGQEFYGSLSFSKNDYNLYGYDHNIYQYTKSDIAQKFQDVTIRAGVKNNTEGPFGIHYDPNIELSFFSNIDHVRESNLKINLPVQKFINETFSAKLEVNADLSSYTTRGIIPNNYSYDNNAISISPSIQFTKSFLYLNAGVTPVFAKGKSTILPNIFGEIHVQDQAFIIQAGLVGNYIKNTYQYLSSVNPYILNANTPHNTIETEIYGGIKTSAGKHLVFNAKLGFVTYKDLALFINDTAFDNKGFIVSNEKSVNNLRIHGSITYLLQDKLSMNAALTLNGYTGLQSNARAWGTLPMEAKGNVSWWPIKKLMLKGDIYMFGLTKYLAKGNIPNDEQGGSDLSLGAAYKINKQFSAWLDANNVFNDKYQRWHGYPVYGFNVMAGILIRF